MKKTIMLSLMLLVIFLCSCGKLTHSKAKSIIRENTPKDTFVVKIPPYCIKNIHGYEHGEGYMLDDIKNENMLKTNNYINLMLEEGYLEKVEGTHTTSSGSWTSINLNVTEKGKKYFSESRSNLFNSFYPKYLAFVVYDAEIDQINSIRFPMDSYAEVIYTKKNNTLNSLGKLLNFEQRTDSRTYNKTLVKCDQGWCINNN